MSSRDSHVYSIMVSSAVKWGIQRWAKINWRGKLAEFAFGPRQPTEFMRPQELHLDSLDLEFIQPRPTLLACTRPSALLGTVVLCNGFLVYGLPT